MKVYYRPYIAIVEYRLSYSLTSIGGYIGVLVVRYSPYRNVIRVEGYYLV